MIFRNPGSIIKKTNSISRDELIDLYGSNSYEFTQTNKEEIFVCSKNKDLDLIELDQLLQTVGWSRRPIRRVKRALDFSILVVGLWRHDNKFPRIIGFARCTGDGILEATVWDVAINPVYQGLGLGKELMKYVLKELKNIGISKVTLFADAEVVSFYKRQGWILEPRGYGLSKAGFRDLPKDELIEKLWETIPNKSWKFVFGLMATYGLRNHEVFFCDLSSLTNFGDKIIRVLPTTKTGEHQVWPFHPEWVEKFELSKLGDNPELLPNINRNLKITTLQNIGKKITDQFKRYSLQIKPYDLRHAWAVRTIFYDLPDTVAARMMGHSVSLHTQTYHHWITKRDQQQAVNNALLRVKRA